MGRTTRLSKKGSGHVRLFVKYFPVAHNDITKTSQDRLEAKQPLKHVKLTYISFRFHPRKGPIMSVVIK